MAFVTQDSGKREQFKTGSRRDTEEGKARVDLIPTNFTEAFTRALAVHTVAGREDTDKYFLHNVRQLAQGLDPDTRAIQALTVAVKATHIEYRDNLEEFKAPNFAVAAPLLRLGALLGRGAAKYGERNWELGQPLSRAYHSLYRHACQFIAYNVTFMASDEPGAEEDHYAAVLFNAMMMWTFSRDHKLDDKLNDLNRDNVYYKRTTLNDTSFWDQQKPGISLERAGQSLAYQLGEAQRRWGF